MKKGVTILLAICFVMVTIGWLQGNHDSAKIIVSDQQDQVEKSVLDWADKTFEYYDGARFEKFEAASSPEFEKLNAKLEGMKEYKQEISDQFKAGELNKTQEEFDKMLKKTNRKIDSLQNLVNTTPAGSSGFEIDFWANILTNNGLTVYYKHHVILNKDFSVTSYKMTSAVGKANDEQKILLKDKK